MGSLVSKKAGNPVVEAKPLRLGWVFQRAITSVDRGLDYNLAVSGSIPLSRIKNHARGKGHAWFCDCFE